LRRDALAAAAEMIVAIEARAKRDADLVATVGRIEALPGATNVIPGSVRFTLDLRAPRDEHRRDAAAEVRATLMSIGARRNVTVDIRQTHEGVTTTCATWMQDQIGKAIGTEGLPVRRLPSGAGHDGMALVDLADIGMLFVRCEAGISHNPLEAITPDDAGLSAQIFLRFIEHSNPPRESRPMPSPPIRAIEEYLAGQRVPQTQFLAELVKVPSTIPRVIARSHGSAPPCCSKLLASKSNGTPCPRTPSTPNGMISATNLIVRERFGPGPPLPSMRTAMSCRRASAGAPTRMAP
jgi:hypothetical protein